MVILAVSSTILALPSPTPVSRAFIPHCNVAFTGHAGSEWDGGGGRYGVVQAGPCDTIYRERGVKEKNQLGRSVFVSG